VLVCLGCAGEPPDPRVLRLRQATPEPGATGVYLNEPVELFFSNDIDPASVHAQSARILALDDAPARGRWELSGRRLTFTPDPVLAADLSDGGYQPGQTYRVELSGFPRPDGLRGLGGQPLPRTMRWEFRVVSAEDAERGFLFADSSLERGLPLVLRTLEIPPGGPIVLEGEEPLDPSTLFGEDFLLLPSGDQQAGSGEFGTPIPLRARLVQNFDKRARPPRGTTQVELTPQQRLVHGQSYLLRMEFQPRLRDFGGHPVPYLPTLTGKSQLIEVRESSAPRTNVHFEPFLGTENRSPEVVPGADGTAWWGSSGRIELRLPAAVGDGRAGTVELTGAVEDPDLQAVRLRVPAGQTAELPAGPGLVVMRAQGSLQIEGVLSRRGPVANGPSFLERERLSAWLRRAADTDLGATVLIAGGDLIVSGELDVVGTLILVAGGRVRLGGRPERLRASKIFVLGEGGIGPSFLDPETDRIKDTLPAPLELDLSTENPLVEPLTFAVRSGPIPREGQAAQWHGPHRPGGHHGSGEYRVRYVGLNPSRFPGDPTERVVEDPVQLSESPNLRLQVELTVRPGVPWDPPWVDFAEVSWDPVRAERPR